MDTDLLRAALRDRCSIPYGPFVIIHWPPQQWGVMRSTWLEDSVICRHLLEEPAERCRAWLSTTTTSPDPLMTSPVAALQLVAALLHEAARNHSKQSRLLLVARLEALDAIWTLVRDAEIEPSGLWPLERQERRAQPRHG